MNRFLRVGYVAPRLIGLVALYFLLQWGAGWALRTAIVAGGQAAAGARVELARSAVTLHTATAELDDFAVADARSPMENLVQAERIALDLDTAALLRGRVEVVHGEVAGLVFGAARETSGALPDTVATAAGPVASWVPQSVGNAVDEWLSDTKGRISTDAADQFESVRLAKELAQRWPMRYESLRADSKAIEAEVRALRDQAKEAKRNPLRGAELLQQLPQRVADLDSRLGRLHQQLAALPGELKSEKARIAEARISDQALLRRRLSVNQLDSESLTSYLLGTNVTGPLGTFVEWARWARGMVPSSKPPKRVTPRDRGVDVLFAGLRPKSSFLVHELTLDGVAPIGGVDAPVHGVLRDLASEPALHGEPTTITLTCGGEAPFDAHITLDRTGATPRDELLVDCPSLRTPAATLGRSERLRIGVGAADASLSVVIRIEGDRLSGDLQLVQLGVALDPRVAVGDGAFGERVQQAVSQSLSSLPRAETHVVLSGTLDKPGVKLTSTLGPAVAQSLDRCVAGLVEDETKRVAERAQRLVDERMAGLDAKLKELTDGVAGELAGPREQLAQIASGAANPLLERGLEQIGNRLPGGGKLFR